MSLLEDSTASLLIANLINNGERDLVTHNVEALLALLTDSALYAPMYPAEESSNKQEDSQFYKDFDEVGEDLMTIFPNPASHQITLEFELPENTENAQLQVFGIDGRFVMAKTVNPKSTTLQLSVSDHANGVYVYLLTADGKLIARKKLTISK